MQAKGANEYILRRNLTLRHHLHWYFRNQFFINCGLIVISNGRLDLLSNNEYVKILIWYCLNHIFYLVTNQLSFNKIFGKWISRVLSFNFDLAVALNCYQCSGSDPEKPFQCNEWLTSDINIQPEPCDNVYGAKYCVKHIGRFEGIQEALRNIYPILITLTVILFYIYVVKCICHSLFGTILASLIEC